MIQLKICGITRLEDALLSCTLGASALGFVFFQESKRYIAPDTARNIVAQLPPFVSKVGVFVNETNENIMTIASSVGLTALQLHGEEDMMTCQNLKEKCHLPLIKAFRIKSIDSLEPVKAYTKVSAAFLLDSHSDISYGGTGKVFNWELANTIKDLGVPLIMAGGINDQNIWDAIRIVNPYALDVASSIESSPGIKDHDKLSELFRVVSI